MLSLMVCELMKLKRSKIALISILGIMSTPGMMFIVCLQTHFEYSERVLTLAGVYENGLLYMMLLTNMMIYIVITAHLFSREYTENTLKTILPIPISRNKLLMSKFFILFLWTAILTFLTWAGIMALSGIYHMMFGLEGYTASFGAVWLVKYLLGSVLIFFTLSPFAYISIKTKGFVAPVIASAVIVMGSAALCNQNIGAIYPWTATYFLAVGKVQSTGYPVFLVVFMIGIVSAAGFLLTFYHFEKEDLK